MEEVEMEVVAEVVVVVAEVFLGQVILVEC